MTFKARPIAPFKIDILSASDPSTFSAGSQIPCTGSPSKTNATVSSGRITLPAGSHWRIEYSAAFAGLCQFEIGLFSITDNGYIGQSLWGTTPTQNPTRKGRVVACALILNSDIVTSKTIEARIISQTNMAANGESGTTYLYNGLPTFRIMELPA